MPSTNKLSSRIRGNSLLGPRSHIARFLLSFCGIFASFGVVTKALVAGIVFLATFAIPASITSLILSSSNNAYATGNSSSNNTVSATLPGSVAVRLLNAEGTTEISSLDFNLTPTTSGTSATQSMVVDVATSNPTGYKLYMQSDYKDSSNNYTNSLVHTTNHIPDSDIADTIPTYVPGSNNQNPGSGSGTNTLYWNYTNPLTSSTTVIPTYGYPDKLAELFTTTNSDQTTVPFSVSVDTTIVSGTYENELLFSAVANPTTSTYTLSFDTDGGTMTGGDIVETAMAWTHSIEIPNTAAYTPTKSGYTFDHWLDEDTGTTYNPGDSVTITSDESFAGSVELKAIYKAASLAEACSVAPVTTSAGSPYFTYDGVDYIKLYTNSTRTTTACYTKDSQGVERNWTSGAYYSGCPSGTIIPSKSDFDGLVATYGDGSGINNTTGWVNRYWSSTTNSSGYGYGFVVKPSSATGEYVSYAADGQMICRSQNTIASATYMQEVETCPADLPVGEQYTLTDRGEPNKSYTASKLADGKCWMTQNYNRSSGTITSTNYNTSSNFTIPTSSKSYWDETTGACYDGYGNCYYSDSNYGGYYSWYTATAGVDPSSGDSLYDICPKGWRLPTSIEFDNLINVYSASSAGNNLHNPPVNMEYYSYCHGGIGCPRSDSMNIYGFYWTSTKSGSPNFTSGFSFSASQATTYTIQKRYGFSVRCVSGS